MIRAEYRRKEGQEEALITKLYHVQEFQDQIQGQQG